MRHYTLRVLSAPEIAPWRALPESVAATLICGCLGGNSVSEFFARSGSLEFREADPPAVPSTASCDELERDGLRLEASVQLGTRVISHFFEIYDRAQWFRFGRLCRIFPAIGHGGSYLQLM